MEQTRRQWQLDLLALAQDTSKKLDHLARDELVNLLKILVGEWVPPEASVREESDE